MATKAAYFDQGEAAAPATPATGVVRTYAKADGLMYSKDDAGVETLMSGGAGGAGDVTTDAVWDAAGDLVQGTGANTAAKLTVGATGTRLEVVGGSAAWVNAVAAKAYHNTTESHTTSGSWQDVSLNSEDFDTDTMHDLVTANDNITVPETGLYFVRGQVLFAANSLGLRGAAIEVGGTIVTSNVQDANEESGSSTKVVTMGILSLTAADVVNLAGYQNSTAALNMGHASDRPSQNELSIVKLGVL